MTLVIGVDGGGTHARAVIVDAEGTELGRGEARGAVVRAEAPALAAKAVTEAVRTAADRAGVELPAAAMWAGLAGAGLQDARRAVTERLQEAALARRVMVGTDVEAAFHGAFGSGPGVLLIAGTGSIGWARSPDGEVVRVGGWGERLGDEGSGFAIGMAALRAVTQSQDGRGPETSLSALVLETLSLSRVEDLVTWCASASKADVAALVPTVAAAAASGDSVAAAVLEQAVRDLGAHLDAVLARGGPWPEPPELVLWGGLVGRNGTLHQAMTAALEAYPVRLSARGIDPAKGAAELALIGLREATPEV